MAFRIEFEARFGLPFCAEFLIASKADGTGLPVASGSHEFSVSRYPGFPYRAGWEAVCATTENGMIRAVDPGLLVVTIPPDRFPFGCGPCRPTTLPFRLTSNRVSLLAEGFISFGDH